MMSENPVIVKSKDFALRIIRLYRYLCDEKKRVCIIEAAFAQRDKHWGEHRGSTVRNKQKGIFVQDVHSFQGMQRITLLA